VAKALDCQALWTERQQFETDRRQGLRLENFLLKFLELTIYQQVPKLFSGHELRGLVDKTTAKQPKIQQFESTKFQDR